MANQLAERIMSRLCNQPELPQEVEEGINAAWNNISEVVENVTDEFLEEIEISLNNPRTA